MLLGLVGRLGFHNPEPGSANRLLSFAGLSFRSSFEIRFRDGRVFRYYSRVYGIGVVDFRL